MAKIQIITEIKVVYLRIYTLSNKWHPKTHGDSQMRKLAQEAFVVEYIRRIRRKDRGIGGSKLWQMYHREFGRGAQ